MRRLEAVLDDRPGVAPIPRPDRPGRRRLPHGKYAFAASIIVAAAVVATSLTRGPASVPEVDLARQPITAVATVSEVVDTVVVRATYAVGDVELVPAPQLEGADPVVTRLGVVVGEQIADGQLVAAVAGRPVIAALGPFPMYRTIVPNDRGEDVEAVQHLLARTGYLRSSPDGVFGRASRDAYQAFMAAHGHGVAKGFSRDGRAQGPIIPKGELAFLPNLPAKVASVDVDVGDRVAEALIRVQAAPAELGFDATPDVAVLLATGQAVLLSDTQAGLEAESRIQSIDRTNTATHRVLLDVPDLLTADDLGRNLRAIVRLHEADPVLNVPLAAIQTMADGSTSVQVVVDGTTSERPVAVGRVAVGRAVIESGLNEGDRVVVGWYRP